MGDWPSAGKGVSRARSLRAYFSPVVNAVSERQSRRSGPGGVLVRATLRILALSFVRNSVPGGRSPCPSYGPPRLRTFEIFGQRKHRLNVRASEYGTGATVAHCSTIGSRCATRIDPSIHPSVQRRGTVRRFLADYDLARCETVFSDDTSKRESKFSLVGCLTTNKRISPNTSEGCRW